MKRIYVLILMIFLTIALNAQANRLTILLSPNKTTHLIFHHPIKTADRGTDAFLVQKAKGITNVLQLKAAREYFPETNLSVITTDGKFYSFSIQFSDSASNSLFADDSTDVALFEGKQENVTKVQRDVCSILGQPPVINLQHGNQLMKIGLDGIFISGNLLWFRMYLENLAEIPFETENVRFYLHDTRRAKRTAVQEIEVFPFYQEHPQTLAAKERRTFIAGFHSFVLSPHQRLVIKAADVEMRQPVSLSVRNKYLLQTKKI